MFSVLTDKGRQNFGLLLKEVDVLNYILLSIGDFTTIATLQPILMRVQCKKSPAMWTRFFVLRAPIDTNKETFVFINFDRTFFVIRTLSKIVKSRSMIELEWYRINKRNKLWLFTVATSFSSSRENCLKFLGIRNNNIVSFLLFLSKIILRYSWASKSQ